jgi:Carbohydrate-selective porin
MRKLPAGIALLALASSAFAEDEPSFFDQLRGHAPPSITGNPAAESIDPGTGLTGRLLHLPEDRGVRVGGIWLGDTNGLISGGAQPGKWSWNSALIVGANVDAEKLVGWDGASFGIQFLQFNGQDTNGQAGSVQGYNSLPGPVPRDRSELYQLWYRQTLFDEKVIFRIGKVVPTFDFNNVARPVPTQDQRLDIPAVTSLLYTPVFVNPTLLGAIGGYYNSVSGFTLTVAPTDNVYLSYGLYDGNVARGVRTGMMGPQFNGYWFNIWEAGADWVIADQYPGNIGAGLWHQTGVLDSPSGASENGMGGFYLFGSQRIWSHVEEPFVCGKGFDDKSPATPEQESTPHVSSVSAFFQFGANNSVTLPVNQYFGMGLTGFGLVPHRPKDSLGMGMAWSWLNPESFDRSSELMFQGYYQAHLVGGAFLQPGVSYIPTPGVSPDLGGAWALTFRVTVLF